MEPAYIYYINFLGVRIRILWGYQEGAFYNSTSLGLITTYELNFAEKLAGSNSGGFFFAQKKNN